MGCLPSPFDYLQVTVHLATMSPVQSGPAASALWFLYPNPELVPTPPGAFAPVRRRVRGGERGPQVGPRLVPLGTRWEGRAEAGGRPL